MQQFTKTTNRIRTSLSRLSGRMSRGIRRRWGTNVLSEALTRVERKTFSSQLYWEQRYRAGGNSGAGSFGPVAEFKASTLNGLIPELQIESVIELGCGDGNQLALYTLPNYRGFDVSEEAIQLCQSRFKHDERMSFHSYPDDFYAMAPSAELSLSIDVLFHLVEDNVFNTYLYDLFTSAEKYVIIFSTAFDQSYETLHQVNRDFRNHIDSTFPEFTLDRTLGNPHKGLESQADFFVYRRRDL